MIGSVLAYMVWPALIILSYWMIRWALRRFEKQQEKD